MQDFVHSIINREGVLDFIEVKGGHLDRINSAGRSTRMADDLNHRELCELVAVLLDKLATTDKMAGEIRNARKLIDAATADINSNVARIQGL